MRHIALFGLISFLVALVNKIITAYGSISFVQNRSSMAQGVKAFLVINGSKPYRFLRYEKRVALPGELVHAGLDLHRINIRIASITNDTIGIDKLLDRLDRVFIEHFKGREWKRIAPDPEVDSCTSAITENPYFRHSWDIDYWSEGSIPNRVIRAAIADCFELDDLSLNYEKCQRRSKRHMIVWAAGVALSLILGFGLRMTFPSAMPLWGWTVLGWYVLGMAWLDIVFIHEAYSRIRMIKV
jgi:hypothetical protein